MPDSLVAWLEQPPQNVIDAAIGFSKLSPCRSKRGVVVFVNDYTIGGGYNYKPRGFDCDGSDTCKLTCRDEAIHAEQQALLSVGRRAEGADLLHVKSVNGMLVPSGPPSCVQCSKLALVAGIVNVWLFRGEDGWVKYPAAEFHRLSLLAWQEEQGKESCKWTEDEDGIYQTDCGHSFNFDTDGPRENGGWFCFYCGKSLEPVRFSAAPAPKGR